VIGLGVCNECPPPSQRLQVLGRIEVVRPSVKAGEKIVAELLMSGSGKPGITMRDAVTVDLPDAHDGPVAHPSSLSLRRWSLSPKGGERRRQPRILISHTRY
jgi:hypothetical protein